MDLLRDYECKPAPTEVHCEELARDAVYTRDTV